MVVRDPAIVAIPQAELRDKSEPLKMLVNNVHNVLDRPSFPVVEWAN